jgi:hypothetical protein
MDLFRRLAEKLPTGAEPAKTVSLLKASITEHTGDLCALAHVQLYKTYYTLANKRPFFAPPFRYLAKYHLEEALVSANVWPEPWAILGGLQLKKGDLWQGLQNLTKFIKMQRIWMQNTSDPDGQNRLDLCQYLTLAASARCQLGQITQAREGFSDAMEEFNQLEMKVRISENIIEDSILLGISGCLLIEHKYAEAEHFIDTVLAERVFSAYQSPARLHLEASKEMVAWLADETRDFQSPPFAEELWAAVMNDIQQCETPEEAREARKAILSTIKTQDVNRQVQALAVAVEKTMKQQESAIQSIQVNQPITFTPPSAERIDLTQITDPELRENLETFRRTADARTREFNRLQEKVHHIGQSLSDFAIKLIERNIASVRNIADQVYRVPLRYQAEWLLLNAARFIVQILAVGYFLDKVVGKLIEDRGKSLSEILNLEHKEIIIAIVVLVIGFVAGSFAEKKIDDLFLVEYKRVLSRIVLDGSNKLWSAYNTFLKLLAENKRALNDIEGRIQNTHDGDVPP